MTEHLTDSEFNSNCDLEDESNSEDELNYEIESHFDNFQRIFSTRLNLLYIIYINDVTRKTYHYSQIKSC